MDAQTKRTLAATALCLLLLFGWIKLQQVYNPPAVEPPVDKLASGTESASTPTVASSTQPAATGAAPAAPTAVEGLDFVGGESRETIVLGDDRQDNKREAFDNPYKFGVTISPVGASVEALNLSEQRSHVAKDRKNPDHAPYKLLEPVKNPFNDERYQSFATENLRLVDAKKEWNLKDAVWTLDKSTGLTSESATLTVSVREGGKDVARLTKTYVVEKNSPHLKIAYEIENLFDRPQRVRLTEGGPVGFHREDLRYDSVRAIGAVVDEEGRVKIGDQITRAEVYKLTDQRRPFVAEPTDHFLWTSVSNKYFTCLVAPRPERQDKSAYPKYLEQLYARTGIADPVIESDLTVVQVYSTGDPLPPGGKVTLQVNAYCGPKSDTVFKQIPEAVAGRYELVMAPDRSGCTFDVINTAMLWLLRVIHGVVRNYGVAIIILVIIVRALLHPISKKGQINMMRMQKNMSRIKPKVESLQEQYKGDKQKLNEETMKLYREEKVNPATSMLGCLPLFLQMPIWVALYTTLNTNVDLRHAPFFGYIRDLSSPDTLISFGSSFQIPLISFLMGGPIEALNVLPIIMTLIMYGQQKLTQKLTRPDKPPEPKLDKEGRPLPDTLAQQQKMMNVMMIFMGFIFYNMPSGLCLYILCSSLLGMGEQWYIRKHIKEKEARGDFSPASKKEGGNGSAAKTGWLNRKLEHWQKLADEQRIARSKNPMSPKPKKKKSRF